MGKVFCVFFLSVMMSGCATFFAVRPEYTPYENIRPNSPRELTQEFYDLTGRPDAQEKIQKQEYVKMGKIEYKATYNKEVFEALKAEAKRIGGDAITDLHTNYIQRTYLDGSYYGARVEVIKYK